MMTTSIAVYRNDLLKFAQLKREHELRAKKDMNAQEFFKLILAYYAEEHGWVP